LARNDRDRKRVVKDTARRGKKKVCLFCQERIHWVDYKDVNLLRRYMSDRGKIRARRVSGNCAHHQREVATAIKTARELALLPYTQRAVSERGPGRRGGRDMMASAALRPTDIVPSEEGVPVDLDEAAVEAVEVPELVDQPAMAEGA
jgi:small subunit ribosomal protein S18